MEPTENGAIFLNIKIQIDKTSDNHALEQVDYLQLQSQYETISVGNFRRRA